MFSGQAAASVVGIADLVPVRNDNARGYRAYGRRRLAGFPATDSVLGQVQGASTILKKELDGRKARSSTGAGSSRGGQEGAAAEDWSTPVEACPASSAAAGEEVTGSSTE
jgi:hypothetical protein